MPDDRHPTRRRRRTGPLWAFAVGAGVLLTAGTAGAATTLILHGRGELVSQPLAGDLAVLDVRLEPALVPGGSADLVLQVRNRSTVTVVADRIRLQLPLRDARPAGCAAKVSGALMQRAGVALVDDQRVTLGPGRAEQVVLPSALTLAASAKQGCGFRVVVDVQAVQADPRPTLSPTRPTAQPTSPPPTVPPPSSPTASPPRTATPPPLPTLDECDPVEPECLPG
jgi:hypothetical protein